MLHSERIEAQEKSRRLMVVLHGLGDSIEGYRWLPEMLALPWMNYLLVNAPDAYFGGFSWYDYAGDPKPGVDRSRKLLTDLLDQQRADGFPTEEMILFGFSQGCLMTIEMGLRYPHHFAGLVGISGYAHEPETLLDEMSSEARRQRFLLTHGTNDPLIPIDLVRPQVQIFQSAGVRIQWHEFDKVHTIAGEEELSVIRYFIRASY